MKREFETRIRKGGTGVFVATVPGRIIREEQLSFGVSYKFTIESIEKPKPIIPKATED